MNLKQGVKACIITVGFISHEIMTSDIIKNKMWAKKGDGIAFNKFGLCPTLYVMPTLVNSQLKRNTSYGI